MQFIIMREKQILARLLESRKKIGGNHAFFRDNLQTIILKSAKKLKQCMAFFFYQIEALLSLKNSCLPPIFFLNTKNTC